MIPSSLPSFVSPQFRFPEEAAMTGRRITAIVLGILATVVSCLILPWQAGLMVGAASALLVSLCCFQSPRAAPQPEGGAPLPWRHRMWNLFNQRRYVPADPRPREEVGIGHDARARLPWHHFLFHPGAPGPADRRPREEVGAGNAPARDYGFFRDFFGNPVGRPVPVHTRAGRRVEREVVGQQREPIVDREQRNRPPEVERDAVGARRRE